MDSDLHIIAIRHAKTAINRRRGGSPIFMQLQSDSARQHLLLQRHRQRCIAFAGKTDINRQHLRRL